MSITGLNPEKCASRNRIAAKRHGVNSHPIKFLRGPVPVGQGVTSALGTFPADDEAALSLINGLRPDGAEPLTLEQVWIHPAEAANNSFIGDRYAFLSTKTLKNIARDAQAGFAFMNSHRTGDYSHPSELPYGRTLAGRYEKSADGFERTLISFYMMRNQYPNGRSGPSTDDLHVGIDGGTIFDVSVGLWGGTAVCDVCGNDVRDYDECPHYPGTDYNMTDEQMDAQRARGVADGLASYTLDDARCNETSAVYDGAVTGAGFNKALSGVKSGNLKDRHLDQVKSAYGSLLGKGDLDLENKMAELLNALGDRIATALGAKKDKSDKHSPASAVPVPTEEEAAQANTDAAEEETEEEDETPETTPPTSDTEPTTEPDPEHPVLQAARAAGVHTPEEFALLLRRAENGDAFVVDQREKAKKLAAIALGNTTPAERAQVAEAQALIAKADLEQLKSLNSMYERFAQKLGLHREDGKPQARQSASAELPVHSVDVHQPPAETKATILPASDIYDIRRQQAEEARRKR